MTTEQVWLGGEQQPVGEYPQVPSMVRALKSLDEVEGELAGLRAANTELQQENVALQAKLDDTRAEVANLTDHQKRSGRVYSEMSAMLAAYQEERDELRDQVEELDDYRELQVRVQELEQDNAKLCGERDTWRARAAL